jgi:hypothetical protein
MPICIFGAIAMVSATATFSYDPQQLSAASVA